MIGLDASTGKRLSGLVHLRQSVRDILTTPNRHPGDALELWQPPG
ncbi:GPW/gp25 family protein [Parasedimentitalea psychrophila]|uniref:Uncharacterized protein n=1 Tax=Parasedimentitalea psychrophila TaxID=2997337 RepID=A0A9Y2P158_9RHOB|nr:hypothetical protein [Parasedimentitalea psychrophila]WIY23807.1 hypothetical protein QPJ95_14285 [Parasedimentitalea psychrophila]